MPGNPSHTNLRKMQRPKKRHERLQQKQKQREAAVRATSVWSRLCKKVQERHREAGAFRFWVFTVIEWVSVLLIVAVAVATMIGISRCSIG